MGNTADQPPDSSSKAPRTRAQKINQRINETNDSSLDPDKQPYDNLLKRLVAHLYGLLPTMENLTKELLLEGIERMIHYYQDDQQLLREELLCFKVMLQRAQRLSDTDMEAVLERIHMYDPLLEEDPWVKSLQEKSLAKGLAEGELRSARDFVTNAVRRRFPDLAILAEVLVLQLDQSAALQYLFDQILDAPDENAARMILETYPHK